MQNSIAHKAKLSSYLPNIIMIRASLHVQDICQPVSSVHPTGSANKNGEIRTMGYIRNY